MENQLRAASGRKPLFAMVAMGDDFDLKPAGIDAVAGCSRDELALIQRGNADAAGKKVRGIFETTAKRGRSRLRDGLLVDCRVKHL